MWGSQVTDAGSMPPLGVCNLPPGVGHHHWFVYTHNTRGTRLLLFATCFLTVFNCRLSFSSPGINKDAVDVSVLVPTVDSAPVWQRSRLAHLSLTWQSGYRCRCGVRTGRHNSTPARVINSPSVSCSFSPVVSKMMEMMKTHPHAPSTEHPARWPCRVSPVDV